MIKLKDNKGEVFFFESERCKNLVHIRCIAHYQRVAVLLVHVSAADQYIGHQSFRHSRNNRLLCDCNQTDHTSEIQVHGNSGDEICRVVYKCRAERSRNLP